MDAVGLPSAEELGRLERRIRSLSDRLESVEDQLDRVAARRRRPAPPARRRRRGLRRPGEPQGLRAESSDSARRQRPAQRPIRGEASCSGSSLDRLSAGVADDEQRRHRDPAAGRRWRTAAPSPSPAPRRRAAPIPRPGARRARRADRCWRRSTLRTPAASAASASAAPSTGSGPQRSRSPPSSRLTPSAPIASRDQHQVAERELGVDRAAGPDPHRPAHPELGQLAEHHRGARARRSRSTGSSARGRPRSRPPVAPEPVRVVAHLRLLQQLLGEVEGPRRVAGQQRVGGDRGGRGAGGSCGISFAAVAGAAETGRGKGRAGQRCGRRSSAPSPPPPRARRRPASAPARCSTR